VTAYRADGERQGEEAGMADKTDKLIEKLRAKGIKVTEPPDRGETRATFVGPKGAKAAPKGAKNQ
jgi:hypothetical protein